MVQVLSTWSNQPSSVGCKPSLGSVRSTLTIQKKQVFTIAVGRSFFTAWSTTAYLSRKYWWNHVHVTLAFEVHSSQKRKKKRKKTKWPSVIVSNCEFLILKRVIKSLISSWWCHLNREKLVVVVLDILHWKKTPSFYPKRCNFSNIGHIKPCNIVTMN